VTYSKTVVLPVSPDEAFALVTEPERLRRWQAVSAIVDLQAGGDYRWTITPGHTAAGTYREIEPGRRIVFGWGWVGSDSLPPDQSTVTITVEPAEGGGSQVTLTHAGLEGDQAEAHARGWDHYLERLGRIATTGDAGPDEWSAMPESLDPVTAAEACLAALQPVLRHLTPSDQPKPTPCTDFTCHDVAEHLMASMEQLGAMAGATVTNPDTGSLENRVSVMAAEAIEGWRTVDLGGTVPGPGGSEMPASMAAGILSMEIALHGWDIAQSSGQPFTLPDDLVAYLRGHAEALVPGGRGSSFAAEVTPPTDASPLDQLAAFAGRTPLSVSPSIPQEGTS
jgi:uncharacterized protein (TIGR03086 family)